MASKRDLLALAASMLVAAAATLALPSPALGAGGPFRATPVAVSTPDATPDVMLIPDTYIVSMKEGVDTGKAVKALRLRPHRTFGKALNGFAVKLTKAQLKSLSHNADVLIIEQDAWHTNVLNTTQPNPPAWGIDRIDQLDRPLSKSYTFNATGAGVHAYVLDTGIAPHPNFGGRASFDFNAIDDIDTDCNNHGTHVAGTIGSAAYGVAKGVRLHGVKWLNCEGIGTTSSAIAAVNWVTANRIAPAVANASWNASFSLTLANALTNMMQVGVFLAASAGNTGEDSCHLLPRHLPAVLVVASTTITDTRAVDSSSGPCVDIYGPGSGIVSTVPGGGTAALSGTSMATPHATGIAALLKATFGDAAQPTVHNWITANASVGVVNGILSGTPNRLLNKRAL